MSASTTAIARSACTLKMSEQPAPASVRAGPAVTPSIAVLPFRRHEPAEGFSDLQYREGDDTVADDGAEDAPALQLFDE